MSAFHGVDQHPNLAMTANILRLLSHPARLSIALLLLSGPQTVSFLETHLGIKQPNLSQHLSLLRDAAVLTSTRKAKSAIYEIHPGLAERILISLAEALTPHKHSPTERTQNTSPAAPAPYTTTAPASLGVDEGEALMFATVHYPHTDRTKQA